MSLRTAPLAICFALAAADCTWDSPPTSDFITYGAGEAVARAEVEQARDIWPPASLDNNIVFDFGRLLAPPVSASPSSSSSLGGVSSGSAIGGAQ